MGYTINFFYYGLVLIVALTCVAIPLIIAWYITDALQKTFGSEGGWLLIPFVVVSALGYTVMFDIARMFGGFN